MSDSWAVVASMSAAVQAIVVVLAAVYAVAQVRESQRARDLSSLIQLYSQIDSDSAREDRRRLHNELPVDLTGLLSSSDYALVYRIVGVFTFLGDLIDKRIVSFDLIADSHARPISRNWQRLEPWVRLQRQHEPLFANAFQHLGERCMKWDRERHGADIAVPFRHSD